MKYLFAILSIILFICFVGNSILGYSDLMNTDYGRLAYGLLQLILSGLALVFAFGYHLSEK